MLIDEESTVADANHTHLESRAILSKSTIPTFSRITISKRDAPPAHFTLRIESFSKLCDILKSSGLDKYESEEFESWGFRWKLLLYPFRDAKDGSKHISLYLQSVDVSAVYLTAILRFFIYDQIEDCYLTLQDNIDNHYHSLKTENGFDQLISLEMFSDPSNGYLVDDYCEFGVEVDVVGCLKGEKFSIEEEPANSTFTWKIENFSTITKGKEKHISQKFRIAKHKWKLELYPKGDAWSNGKSLSLYLQLLPPKAHNLRQRVYAECKLILKDQVQENHCEQTVTQWFTSSCSCWGIPKFMVLKDIYDASNGYLVNDTLIIEAKISRLTLTEGLF